MLANGYDDLQDKISDFISELHNEDGLKRQKARLALVHMGWEAAPALIDVAANETGCARWEAIEALERIKDPSAAPVLVDALLDEDVNVRWAASQALIELDRTAIKPLLEALTEHFESPWLREGAHHVLHVLKDRGRLMPKEIKVFDALEGVEPVVEAPWAAEAALEDISFIKEKQR